MKKIFAILVAAATLASLAVPAWADDEATTAPSTGATSATGDAVGNIDANGKFEAATGGADKISVVVSWTDMTFTYNGGDRGDWLPGDHKYENETKPYWEEKNATITVTNHSSVAVSADFAFASATGSEIEKTITAEFSNEGVIIESANSEEYQTATDGKYPAPAASTKFTVTGGAIAAKTANLGTITVTIGKYDGLVYSMSAITTENKTAFEKAIQDAIAEGTTDFTITVPADADNDFFNSLQTAFANAEAGTIHLTLAGVTKIPKWGLQAEKILWLKTIALPDVTEIENYAFYKRSDEETKLTSVSAPKCTSIGDYAFWCCTALTSVSFPKVQTVAEFAFDGCSALTSISMPKCTVIGQYAFRDCAALTSVSLPEVQSLDTGAFVNCNKIAQIFLPKCTTVAKRAFLSCGSLISVDLPVATSVGEKAFTYCPKLTSITFGKPITAWGKNMFVDGNETLQYKTQTANITLTFAAGQKTFSGSDTDGWTITADGVTAGENGVFCGYTFKEIKIASAD